MSMGCHTPYIPKEIITEILKRLPVKSIIRFRCVSKEWKSLIRSPSFIANHLNHQSPSLLFREYGSEPLHLRLMDCEMHVREVQNPAMIDSLSNPRIIGCSNGLLCVASHEYDISTSSFLLCTSLLLWNPSIGEVRQIPITRTVRFPHRGFCTTGFGFSAIVNDYKIVNIYVMRDKLLSGVEVYSLNTDSWKEIGLGSLEGVTLVPSISVSVNGAIFWYGPRKKVDDIHYIISFDIAKEVFSLIPLPPLLNISRSEFRMTVYNDKLAILSLTMFGSIRELVSSLIDLWVLEEGLGSSTDSWGWTKKYARNPCPSVLDFPGTIWRNEIVFNSFGRPRFTRSKMKNDKEKDYLYMINIITNEDRMSPIPGYRFDDVLNYVENLVPVSNIRFEGSST